MHKALQESLEQSRLENINQAWAHYDTPGFLYILLGWLRLFQCILKNVYENML